MQRLQPMPRLFMALLLALGLVGFGQAAVAIGEAASPYGSAVPGVSVAQAPRGPMFIALTGRIEAVERSFLLRRPEKVGIDVPSIGTLLIDDTGKGEELKDHVGDLVTLIAMPKLLEDGKLVLAVRAYEVREGRPS